MTKPKFPRKPTLIELKIHSGKIPPFYIRAEKGDKNFGVLVLWAKVMFGKMYEHEQSALEELVNNLDV